MTNSQHDLLVNQLVQAISRSSHSKLIIVGDPEEIETAKIISGFKQFVQPTFEHSKTKKKILLVLNPTFLNKSLSSNDEPFDLLLSYTSGGLEEAFQIWKSTRPYSNQHIIYYFHENELRTFVKYNTHNSIDISIVLPVYNISGYLERCILQLLESTIGNTEIIAVDDGSTDDSLEILRNLARKDKRIKVFSKPNGGCASARNYGFDQSSGEYLVFIDPDDFTHPKMIDLLFQNAVVSGAEITQCGYNEWYESSKSARPIHEQGMDQFHHRLISSPDKLKQFPSIRNVAIWRCMFKREWLKKSEVRFNENLKRFDDLPFIWLAFQRCRSFYSIPNNLYFYSLGRPGQDVSFSDQRLFIHHEIFDYLHATPDASDKKSFTCLTVVELASHKWALSKLDNHLVFKYFSELRKRRGRYSAYQAFTNLLASGFNFSNAIYGTLLLRGSKLLLPKISLTNNFLSYFFCRKPN
jgi:glycosyltransferase involved in cell wall biosynthesis